MPQYVDRIRDVVLLLLLVVGFTPGCTRARYVREADADAYGILREKQRCAPWRPANLSVLPDVRSRFFDPTCFVDPALPARRPVLNDYALPPLTRYSPPPPPQDNSPPADEGPWEELSLVSQAGFVQAAEDEDDNDMGLNVAPLNRETWESLPRSCLVRMLEFESVQEEYQETYDAETLAARPTDDSPRLSLPAIVELALINNREYQTQRERLYRAALRLSLERYDYDLLFLPRGNGNDTSFVSNRDNGVTRSTLASGTSVSLRRISRTGADLFAGFANDVVATFTRDGVSTTVGSRIIFRATQSLLQRDIIFENLTQAERNVVYAARDFARFRKEFFRDFAQRYYGLLLTYRAIEIDSQDYFSNWRAFAKGAAEYQAGRLPRFQVDQFEQNALRSRSNLISSCNALEGALDSFKFELGLPPESSFNVDLSELEELTRQDALTAAGQLADRKESELVNAGGSESDDDLSVRVNTAMELTRRLLRLASPTGEENLESAGDAGEDEAAELPPPGEPEDSGQQRRDAEQAPAADANAEIRAELQTLLRSLAAAEAKLKVAFNARVLQEELSSDNETPPLRLFQRAVELTRALLDSSRRQLALRPPSPARQELRQRVAGLEGELDALSGRLAQVLQERRLELLNPLAREANDLLERVRAQARELDADVTDLNAARLDIDRDIRRLLEKADELQNQQRLGLPEVNISYDDAMLTAVNRRYDLANQRERLADAWRQIKLRGDALRSIVTLRGSHTLRTRSGVNTPFEFTWDDSTTEIGLSFDAPLNRLAERNAFREALIDYNASWRSVMAAEDQVKLSIRNTLRALQLDREQYNIAVASAALAYERVVSTRLQLQQAAANVTARDFLEAQQAYTSSLDGVARARIGYLVDRIQLFLDLEQLEVDELGFWPELYDEDYEPVARFDMPLYCGLPYGELANSVRYSRKMLRMLE